MLDLLTNAWRARRALLIGDPDAQTLSTIALLEALGARTALLPPDSSADALNHAMLSGRVSAVIVPSLRTLCRDTDLFSRLRALDAVLREVREAGIPLCILCSDEDVYAPSDTPAEETAPLGGRSREGFAASILQLYAHGVSRGMLGDAVSSIICRHPPCLGSGHESVRQYSLWCRAILRANAPTIEHPAAQGTFLHPLDAALGALCLGAAFFSDPSCTGCFNIAPAAQNRCANRSAYLSLAAAQGAVRAPAEAYPPRLAPVMQLSGAKIKKTCGFSPMLHAIQALSFLMAQERAESIGAEAAQQVRREQAEAVLSMLK